MRKQPINGGGWFDLDKAKYYEEDSYFDGSNNISEATHDQWTHEGLYRTASGAWVLWSWSQWQGTRDRYTLVSTKDAARWLVQNDEPIPAELASEVEAAEV
jgi:hypothetical protein